MNLNQIIQDNPSLQNKVKKGSFGIERESLRVNRQGVISEADHPKTLGSRDFHPYIITDFAEAQFEFITPTCHSVEEAYNWLNTITQVAMQSMDAEEYLWPLSMPYELDNIDRLSVAKLSDPKDVDYRLGLAKNYGKAKQLVSGVHFNFGLDPEFLKDLHQESGSKETYVEFVNHFYTKLAHNYYAFEWILIYLYGASPIVNLQYFSDQKKEVPDPQVVKALRTSDYGYVNDPDLGLQSVSLEEHVESLEAAVRNGTLSEEKEYYSGIRYRGAERARPLLDKGIQYIECRHVDVNPYDPSGVSLSHLSFLHAFLVFLGLRLDHQDPAAIQAGVQLSRQVSLMGVDQLLADTDRQKARQLLEEFKAWLHQLNWTHELILEEVDLNLQRLDQVDLTLSDRIQLDLNTTDKVMDLAVAYKDKLLAKDYQTIGFEDLELSTQAVIFDAIQMGIQVEVLDPHDQVLRLTYQDQVEIVKNGNMTSLDTYISPLIMDNKIVSKQLLAENKLAVPLGKDYQDIDQALGDYTDFAGRDIVVKPNDTNYGLGISILRPLKSLEDYQAALDLAFSHSATVIVESFQAGTEYRFVVFDQDVRAVLKREAAHVIGDGHSTISQLVEAKNAHPWRGKENIAPLVRLELGDFERRTLKSQGLSVDSILEAGQKAYLRYNSNISTGGDSIDVTDQVHPYYLEIAKRAAQAMGAVICGVDIIIEDLTIDQGDYAILETNYNPMMSMHIFPAQGQARRLSRDLLKLLFKIQ